MQCIILWYLLGLLALAHYIKPLNSQTHICNISWEVVGNAQGITSCCGIGASLGFSLNKKCHQTSHVCLWPSLDALFYRLPLLQGYPAGFHPVGLLSSPACKAPLMAAGTLAILLPVPVQAAASLPQ